MWSSVARYNLRNQGAKKEGDDGGPDEPGRAGRQGIHRGQAQGEVTLALGEVAQEAQGTNPSFVRRRAAFEARFWWRLARQVNGGVVAHRRQRRKARLV